VNSDRDSITVKRAWAEVAVPLGILKFGRMPNHWGLGIFSNSGDHDPIHGTYDLDGDYGDTVDRFSFSAIIPGTNLRAMIATNWDSTRLTSNQTNDGKGREGHPWDLGDEDDITSWIGVISRMDTPTEFRDKVDRGELAFNYGIYFEYKKQHWDNDISGFTQGEDFNAAERYVRRGLTTYTPNPWVRLGYKRIELEAEFVAQLGSVDSLNDYGLGAQDIRKYGGVGKSETASPEAIREVSRNSRSVNPAARIFRTRLEITALDPHPIRGRRVIVVEDGPTLTHGGMAWGAGALFARREGAKMVNPAPYAVGSIGRVYRDYPHIGHVLPAMGYGARQIREFEETIRRARADVVIGATPVDLARLIRIDKPLVQVRYALAPTPAFRKLLGKFADAALRRRR
jgi:hypothetical protein